LELGLPAAPILANEAERLNDLAALRIMDTGPDWRFDSFVKLAADMFGVPIALVTLVDEERQWFKAVHGIELRETKRSAAFCAHAFLNPDEVMVVEDALCDARFADNPLVRGDPHIRFYAGAVVHAPSGRAAGTLCLIDRTPRALDAAGRKRLAELAQGVSALLELQRATVDLRLAATHDALTGVANRALFDHRLELAVEEALQGRPCALLLLDLDGFKQVNDKFGHLAGDGLLREVGRRLTRLMRSGDLVARFGGDEFAILMTDPVSAEAPIALASRIDEALATPITLDGTDIPIAASIGYAICPLDATSPGMLLRTADQALYARKGDRPLIRPAPRGATGPGRRMEHDLQDALENGGLEMHYQPIHDLAAGRICGYEALMRWNRASSGPVSPSVFISVAEASGLIVALDAWAVHQAIRTAAGWPADIGVSVNLSTHWFGEAGVAELVGTAASRYGVSPRRLCVEITERTGIVSQDIARTQIDALHALGVRIALDDFGTGYSSLAYLHELPIDCLKLDRAFVAKLGAGRRSQAVARSVIDLGHSLDVPVCAEGVETRGQLDWLRQNGCDLVQGYLLGRPAADILRHVGHQGHEGGRALIAG
jgi:diguanylate cyclase (GGDEF)-like protein